MECFYSKKEEEEEEDIFFELFTPVPPQCLPKRYRLLWIAIWGQQNGKIEHMSDIVGAVVFG